MDDLISRQAAIDALDRIFDNVPMELTTEILRLRRELRGLHAEDVVPVIRCKDCKHFELNPVTVVDDIPLILAHEICTFWGNGCKTAQDGFCSFGERREE